MFGAIVQIIYIAHIVRRVLKTVRDNTLLDDKVPDPTFSCSHLIANEYYY
jgi:hypothetical protein